MCKNIAKSCKHVNITTYQWKNCVIRLKMKAKDTINSGLNLEPMPKKTHQYKNRN